MHNLETSFRKIEISEIKGFPFSENGMLESCFENALSISGVFTLLTNRLLGKKEKKEILCTVITTFNVSESALDDSRREACI